MQGDGSRPGRALGRLAPTGGAALLVALCLLLSGCGPRLLDQERDLCTLLVPAIVGHAAIILTADPSLPLPPETSVIVRYSAQPSATGAGWVACGFTPGEGVLGPSALRAVVTQDAGALSPIQVFMLREFWLGRHAAGHETAAQPLPPAWTPLRYLLQQLVNAIAVSAIYALVAAGYSLVYGIVGRIHLAFGDFAMLGAYVTLSTFVAMMLALPLAALGLALLVAAGLAMAASAAYGGATAVGGFGRLWWTPGQAPLIATLGLSIAIREGVRLAQGPREPWLPPILTTVFDLDLPSGIRLTITSGQILVVLTALAGYAVLALIMHRTALGRAMRACSDDIEAAALVGVHVPRTMLSTFAIGGAAAALAGTIVIVVYGTIGIEGGFVIGLKALTAAVVGGIGSLHGAFLGGFVVGILETLWSAYFGGAYREVAVFGLLALILVFRPSGLLTRPVLHRNDRFRPR
jgi:branched-chain amino acid transport system permease protein